jgi:hypothetical protein
MLLKITSLFAPETSSPQAQGFLFWAGCPTASWGSLLPNPYNKDTGLSKNEKKDMLHLLKK